MLQWPGERPIVVGVLARPAARLNRRRDSFAQDGKLEDAKAQAKLLLDLKNAPPHLKAQAQKYLEDNQ